MNLFVDSSVLYASIDKGDRSNGRAKEILGAGEQLLCSDHVAVETWMLLRNRLGFHAAERFLHAIRHGAAQIEPVSLADIDNALSIGEAFADQDFSIVDRTSFAVMQRLGVTRVATFDDDFAIYRYGPNRNYAFEVVR